MTAFHEEVYFRKYFDWMQANSSSKIADQVEVARIIRTALARTGLGPPPVDLLRLARHLGVKETRSVPLAIKGRIVLEEGAYIIEMSDELGQFDRRRVLSHEIAHLILEKQRLLLTKNAGLKADALHYRQMERLCNLGAEEILLPKHWIVSKLPASSASLDSVLDLAREAEVPLPYVFERIIRQLRLFEWRALWIRLFRRGVQLVKSIGPPPEWDESFVQVPIDQEPIIRKCCGSRNSTNTRILLRIHDEDVVYRMNCVSSGTQDEALCLLYCEG